MTKRDRIDDLVALVYPWPTPRTDAEQDGIDAWVEDVQRERHNFESNLRLTDENADPDEYDPVLAEIAAARTQMREAEARMRLLIAYAREFIHPHPYQLKDIAASTGMSVSGTRSAYDDDEITEVARRIGRPSRRRTEDTRP